MALPAFLKSRPLMLLVAALAVGLLVERVVAKSEGADEAATAGRADGAVIPPGWPGASTPSTTPVDSAAAAAGTTPAAPAPSLQLERLDGRDADAATPIAATLFERPRARPALAVAPPPPPPAPAPVAPKFPYPYLGGLSDEGRRTAWFGKGERVLAVQAGDTVDGVYRVEQLSANHMRLTYLPLQQTLDLPLGDPR